jgi:hypothetical protein
MTMWDTVETATTHLSHDMPCPGCGHATHTYLSCSDSCACVPPPAPGTMPLHYSAA